MKTILVLIAALTLTACGSKGSDSVQAKGVSPTLDLPTVAQPQEPALVPSPTPTPALVATPTPVPTPTPTPAPVNFSCYTNGDTVSVFCTGGNLGSSLVSLDVAQMFTGRDAREQVVVNQVRNDVYANAHSTSQCSQPNQSGCYLHSVCVDATIIYPGVGSWPYTWCGNAVRTSDLTLTDL